MSEKIIAIDAGFSASKCITDNKMFTFPSHVALTRASSVDLGDRLPGYIFKNERYIVGDPGNTCTE